MPRSASRLILRIRGRLAVRTCEMSEGASEGRRQNECLAICYMLDVVRHFAGPGWVPDAFLVGGASRRTPGALEEVLGMYVLARGEPGDIIFDLRRLAVRRPDIGQSRLGLWAEELGGTFHVPDPEDTVAIISALIGREQLNHYPRLDRISQRSCLRARIPRARLRSNGARFSELARDVPRLRAFAVPGDTDQPVTEIAAQIGYQDAAHFTRALERRAGMARSIGRALARDQRP